MSELPNFLRKLPYLFYALALVLGGWRFLNEWSLVEATYAYSNFGDEASSFAHSIGRSSAIYWGVSDAFYLISSGALLHVLIAIYDKMKGPAE
ncbi:MAG: hypothetical protein AAF250_00920 [Pseudomonadota bacterium]